MHIRLHPLVLAVVAALAGLSVPQLHAADYTGPLVLPDNNSGSEFILGAGDRFSYSGTSTGIRVNQGGRFVSNGGTLDHTGTGGILLYLTGGEAQLDGGSVEYGGSSGRVLYVSGQRSSLTAQNLDINLSHLSGTNPIEVLRVENGAKAVLDGVNINAGTTYSRGLEVHGSGTNLTFENGHVHTKSGTALTMSGAALINMSDTDLRSTQGFVTNLKTGTATFQNVNFTGTGDNLVVMDVSDNATVTLTGGVVDARAASSAIRILGNGTNTQLRLNGTKVYVGEGTGLKYAININEKAQLFLNDVDIESGSYGVRMITPDAGATIDKSRITAAYMGMDATNGVVTITDSSVTTTGNSSSARGYGLYVQRLKVGSAIGKESKIVATNTAVLTKGTGAHGAYSAVGGEIALNGGSVRTEGEGSHAVVVQNSGRVSIDGTVLRTLGAGSAGIVSAINTQALHHETEVLNGASLITQNAPAIVLMGSGGGINTLTISDSQIAGWTNQAQNSGVLLQSQPMQVGGQLGNITFNATNSALTGDVLISAGSAKLNLGKGTQLTGSIQSIGEGKVQQLVLADAATTWNVRGNSWLDSLQQGQGQVAFVSPASTGGAFHNVKVNSFYGGGLIVMNTVLAGDDAATNQLIVNGGTVSGQTSLRVLNVGGKGAETVTGIPLVNVLDGVVTANTTFKLEENSSGYRTESGTLFVGGYDYALLRGGNGGEANSWYLSSTYTGEIPGPVDPDPDPEPTPDPDPDPEPGPQPDPDPDPVPVDPVDPLTPIDPDEPDPEPTNPIGPDGVLRNISPEVGGYLANRIASTQLFSHSLHDRGSAELGRNGGEQYGLWSRVRTDHERGIGIKGGRVSIKNRQYFMQIGGTVLERAVGKTASLHVGGMIGYGETRSRIQSTLRNDVRSDEIAKARGSTHGFSVGVYGTVYADKASRLGAYGDAWLMYGRYSNKVTSSVGRDSYNSTVWSASLEGGYAWLPFSPQSSLSAVVVEPNVQFIAHHYNAQKTHFSEHQVKVDKKLSWVSRAGVRVYPQWRQDEEKASSVRPFAELNWHHRYGNGEQLRVNENQFEVESARNSYQLKVGLESQSRNGVSISGQAFGAVGEHKYRSLGGMIHLRYEW